MTRCGRLEAAGVHLRYGPDGCLAGVTLLERGCLMSAGLGIVKLLEGRRGQTYPDMEWEPKAAFAAVAQRYRR
ncbi:hypothetical protein [Streptomyces sp. NBC_01237]|uniref:hypothetical protein n=1 Tax=Streptomyces sp. NBC_01237 TaxID=2903790 RepID=UPI002DDBE3EF|nr:hypothetical protein [Streptomyces sp. NBC_01237]WRZ78444.1 hypothetical protein OG251_36770 [Streptomyces sp. NBC_01237]